LLVGNQSLQRRSRSASSSLCKVSRQTGAREIIAAVANLAVRTDDEQLKELLAKHGITVSVKSAPSTAAKGK
jgi:hypothetical protein